MASFLVAILLLLSACGSNPTKEDASGAVNARAKMEKVPDAAVSDYQDVLIAIDAKKWASAEELLGKLRSDTSLLKGEFVVLVDNSASSEDRSLNTDDVEMLKVLLEEVSVKKAVKIATRLTGKKKNEIYQQALHLRDLNASADADQS